jgi:endonuclease/exonuclease/phosphatase family metal-dependent hydrolase
MHESPRQIGQRRVAWTKATAALTAALLVLVSCGPAYGQTPAAPELTTLRLLHWNSYHGGRRTDGVYDPKGFVSWIARFNPDVITLNEVDNTAQRDALLEQLRLQIPGASWEFYYITGIMIVSRLPIVSSSKCLVNASANRHVIHIGTVVNGRPLNVWNAHLALDGSAVRLGETRAIQACERDRPEDRVVAGDFNMQAGSAEYQSMAEQHVDAWVAAKALGTAANYPGNCDGCTRNTRIDYVFTSKGASSLTLKSAEVFDTRNASGVMASDHKPLLVVYGVKPSGAAVSTVQNLRLVPAAP